VEKWYGSPSASPVGWVGMVLARSLRTAPWSRCQSQQIGLTIYLFIYVLVLILVMVSRRSTRDMRPAHSSISRPPPTLVSCIFFFSPRQLYLSDLVHRLIPLLTFATTSLLRCPTLFTTCHHLGPPPPPLYFVIISSPPPLLLESGFLTTGDAPIQRDACDLSLS
jgi:hypothetical protein